MTTEGILVDYLDLEHEDVLATLEYGARVVGHRRIPPAG
jgi:uncharacterized protein (DUF433 family)